jgi:hypothetical protein
MGNNIHAAAGRLILAERVYGGISKNRLPKILTAGKTAKRRFKMTKFTDDVMNNASNFVVYADNATKVYEQLKKIFSADDVLLPFEARGRVDEYISSATAFVMNAKHNTTFEVVLKSGHVLVYTIKVPLAHRIARAGLTQAAFAKKMGVSRQQVNNWTSGRSNMSLVYELKADDILK